MNKHELLCLLVKDAETHGEDRYEYAKDYGLEDSLVELAGGREVSLPPSLPRDEKRMISTLRKHFDDSVTFISLVLNHHYPDEYLFYRVSRFEKEIFEGLDFFAEVAPELELPFPRVGRQGFNHYLELNKSLQEFARISWPESEDSSDLLTYFLYEGLGHLFLSKSEYKRYWIVATREEYFHALDSSDDLEWSGRKEMQTDDLVFMYRTAPRKAITDIFRVKDEPLFDPWGPWNSFWVNLERVCAIEDIPLAEMREDSVLGKWGSVRKNFQTTVDPVPHSIYNRLLEKVSEGTKKKHDLKPEQVEDVWSSGNSGKYVSEEEFEDDVVVPLLRRWNLDYRRQHPCHFRFGSQDYRGRVDFYVSDEQGPLKLFENKLKILNDKHLNLAVDQAKSYALMLGFPSFVVASPKGMWLYSLNWNDAKLEKQVAADENRERVEELKDSLLKIRR